MEENKRANASSDPSLGADNESLLSRKNERQSSGAKASAPAERPAYASRRDNAPGERPARPPQRPAAPNGAPARPPQRPAAPNGAPARPPQRPAAPNGAPARPAQSPSAPNGAPARPAQRPSAPNGAPARPPQRPAAPNGTPARPPQRPAAPNGAPARPAQRPAAQNGTPAPAPAPAPVPKENVPVSPVPADMPIPQNEPKAPPLPEAEAYSYDGGEAPASVQKAKPNQEGDKGNSRKEMVSDKQKNAKAGADMMIGIVKAIAYMVVILVVSVFISIFVIRIGNDVFAFVKSDEAVDITIPEDADVGDIAEILHDNGIISFPGIFKLYATLKHEEGPFVAGDYTVSPSMSYDDLRYAFKEQVVTGTVWITIPEGFTTDEIIDLLVENGIGERERYIDVINNYDFDYWFLDELEESELKDGRVYRLEGYLFPDTYEFYKASGEETVIGRMLDRFNEVFVKDYKTKAEELGYTVDEILTIASLVEKEAGSTSQFMNVSSVFHNRLNYPSVYPRLESDATTVYAIQVATGQRPDKVTPEDNEFDHPYNTYKNNGLPPGPITNPSASAIRYALYPANTGFYYFITDNAGKIYFAQGKAEHEQNIALVKRINEDLAG
ncbi:MAG: endolytic transglycosylase MltG [Clostridia bacterium]|nr:endolytic transglycosylase MltG [Clostridia bacterium]